MLIFSGLLRTGETRTTTSTFRPQLCGWKHFRRSTLIISPPPPTPAPNQCPPSLINRSRFLWTLRLTRPMFGGPWWRHFPTCLLSTRGKNRERRGGRGGYWEERGRGRWGYCEERGYEEGGGEGGRFAAIIMLLTLSEVSCSIIIVTARLARRIFKVRTIGFHFCLWALTI